MKPSLNTSCLFNSLNNATPYTSAQTFKANDKFKDILYKTQETDAPAKQTSTKDDESSSVAISAQALAFLNNDNDNKVIASIGNDASTNKSVSKENALQSLQMKKALKAYVA